jgi:hypothetical protein
MFTIFRNKKKAFLGIYFILFSAQYAVQYSTQPWSFEFVLGEE